MQSATFDGPVPGVPGAAIREVPELPRHLPGGVPVAPHTEALPGALLFEIPRIARYLVRDGTTIDVAVMDGADRAAAELFLLGSARGALIHQRGELPLNAATLIAPNWKCVAICCPSVVGKSTLAAALCRRGWLLVADDITRISWNGTMPVAWPSHNRLKLWRDACEMLGADADALQRVRNGLEKYFLPVSASATPAALGVAVRLRIAPQTSVEEVPAGDRPHLLSESTFRPRWIDPLGRRADYARIVREIARGCRAILLSGARERPILELADRLADAVR
ncbi:MAG TPA: hypothetical protein VHX61_06510 [Rhizomicrobium sp.]|nr:hypothetical protein [Rhizomicrobium sp.]